VIVRDVGTELRQRGAATAGQLAAEIGVSRDMVDSALAFWTHRGDVRACEVPTSRCGTACRRCPIGQAGPPSRSMPVVYEWVPRERSNPGAS
jgi:hypothetical protein